jgi:hypothetical protein
VGAGVPGLTSNLALLRVESVSFVAYADGLDSLPADVAPGLLRDTRMSVLGIANSVYPGPLVGWLFDRFAGTLGLEDVRVDDWPARYRQVTDDTHVVVIRSSSTLYFAIASTREGATDLAAAVVRSL